jgi:putative ABC transport system substrate-binding protein
MSPPDAHSRRQFIGTLAKVSGALPLLVTSGSGAAPILPRIGFLIRTGYTELVDAFSGELARLGHIDGETIVIEKRFSQADLSDLPAQAAELSRSNVALILAASLPQAVAVRQAAPDMRMVIATCAGMVSNGFAKGVDHPGGTATGIDELPPGLTAKRLSLLKIAAPDVSRIGLLSTSEGIGGYETQLADAERAAPGLGVSVKPYPAGSLAEIHQALSAMAKDRMQGLVNFQGGLSLFHRRIIIDFVAAHRMPSIFQATLFAEAGGLMAWAPDLVWQYREAARYVDKILRGAKPGDLPVQYPPRYYLTINTATARGVGLTLPPALLAQADRVLA